MQTGERSSGRSLRSKAKLIGFAAGEEGSPEPIPPSEVGVMILERVTAWTLVVLYYCVGCGVILLGLRGAL